MVPLGVNSEAPIKPEVEAQLNAVVEALRGTYGSSTTSIRSSAVTTTSSKASTNLLEG